MTRKGMSIVRASVLLDGISSSRNLSVLPSPLWGSLRNWLVMMGFRTAAVGGGRDATASEGCLAYFLALRQLQDVTLPSSGQLEPALHVVGEPDEVQMRSILGEPDVADPIEAHPALECGEDALYLRPNRGDQCVMALLGSAQRRPATPALVHNAV